MTGRLIARIAMHGQDDFTMIVRCKREQGFTEQELALAIKDRIPDARYDDCLRDIRMVK